MHGSGLNDLTLIKMGGHSHACHVRSVSVQKVGVDIIHGFLLVPSYISNMWV